MKRIADSIWGHVRLLAVHTRLHIGSDKDKDYKVIVTVCMVLMSVGLPLLLTILSFDAELFTDQPICNNGVLKFLYWVFCVHMATLGFVSMLMLELSFYIAHTYCNKTYPEQASKYERCIFHMYDFP